MFSVSTTAATVRGCRAKRGSVETGVHLDMRLPVLRPGLLALVAVTPLDTLLFVDVRMVLLGNETVASVVSDRPALGTLRFTLSALRQRGHRARAPARCLCRTWSIVAWFSVPLLLLVLSLLFIRVRIVGSGLRGVHPLTRLGNVLLGDVDEDFPL